jgi:glutathione S-transferase
VTIAFFGHPFSSYTQKALIALYAEGVDFEFRQVPENEENYAELKRIWPFAKFPVLVDGDNLVVEATCIIEHLQARHQGGNEWIPAGDRGLRVRFLDRFFDLYVMDKMSKVATDSLRPEESRDAFGVAAARRDLNTAYDWLEVNLPDTQWAAGDSFTLADCAAAPSLFYADWVEEVGSSRPKLAAYRARLVSHPAVSRCIEEARPYRHYFPIGAPDRD